MTKEAVDWHWGLYYPDVTLSSPQCYPHLYILDTILQSRQCPALCSSFWIHSCFWWYITVYLCCLWSHGAWRRAVPPSPLFPLISYDCWGWQILALPIVWPKTSASTGRWMVKHAPLVCRFPVGYKKRRKVFVLSIWWRENHSCACHALLVGFVMQRKQSQKTAHSQSKLIGMKSLCSAIRKGKKARGSGYGNCATLFIS